MDIHMYIYTCIGIYIYIYVYVHTICSEHVVFSEQFSFAVPQPQPSIHCSIPQHPYTPKTLNPENPTTVSFISAGLEAVSGTGVWRFTVLFLNDVPRRVTII